MTTLIKSTLRQYIANPTNVVKHPVFQPSGAPTTHSQPLFPLLTVHADKAEVWQEIDGNQSY